LVATGWAQPPGHPPMGGMGMGMGGAQGPGGGQSGMAMMFSQSFLKDQLKLSDEQIDKFRKLRSDYEKESIKRGADLKVAEIELWDLMDKKDLNADQIEKKVREVEGKRTDLRVYRFKQLMTVKTILTPEQFEKFRSMGMMMFGGAGRYGAGMGMKGGQGVMGHPGMGSGGGYRGYDYDHDED
jgi:Spy/CpxP family protein refolding chaperone